ncbi:MAG: hypothetical protein WC262_08330 [Bacteroidales bacterium]|jgi:GT2 family glycosyltransferase
MYQELSMCTFGYNNANLTIQLIESLEKIYNLQDYNFTIADNSTTSDKDYEIAINKKLNYFDNRENKFGKDKGWVNYQSHRSIIATYIKYYFFKIFNNF